MFISNHLRIGVVALTVVLLQTESKPLLAEQKASPAAPLIRLLKSGRVPHERMGSLIELVGQRGNAEDLAYLFQEAITSDKFSSELRLKTLQALTEAANNRKILPGGDLSGLGKFIVPATSTPQDVTLQLAAIRLAGACRAKPLAESLAKVALDEKSALNARQAALDSLVGVDTKVARHTIDQLTPPHQPHSVRSLGVGALAGLDVDAAATAAAEVLAASDVNQDPALLIDAFLEIKGGPDKLAAALSGKELPPDVAKIALRHMYSVGRTDAALAAALSSSAGLSANPDPPSPEEVKALAAEVLARGDAARGEAIFRRADVSCMKCHAVSKAGGQVGPDLSAVGASSPVDYLINSIMQPNQAVKEAFLTRVVVTDAGKVYQGIVVDRNDQRLILKDATSVLTEVPIADIDEEFEGESLMPQGLTKFLTHDEIVDLVRFLSELGKPGPWAVRKTPTIQRWRVLHQWPDSLAAANVDADLLREETLATRLEARTSVYSYVGGGLPLADVQRVSPSPLLYLRAEIDVTVAGKVGFEIDSPAPLQSAVNERPLSPEQEFEVDLRVGRHVLHLLVDTTSTSGGDLRAELFRVDGSKAEFEVIGGQ